MRTELAVAGARGQGDLDPLTAAPCSAQGGRPRLGQPGFHSPADLSTAASAAPGSVALLPGDRLTPPPRTPTCTNNEIELDLSWSSGALRWSRGGRRAPVLRRPRRPSRFTVPHEGPAGLQDSTPRRRRPGAGRAWRPTAPPPCTGTESGDPCPAVPAPAPPRPGGRGRARGGVADGMVAAEVVDEVGDFSRGEPGEARESVSGTTFEGVGDA
ncbi:hypothetical protein LV779_21165 [Streptomyces thinghirensis]|nr:hypothetical protein [Streptomyces thinghirensis]